MLRFFISGGDIWIIFLVISTTVFSRSITVKRGGALGAKLYNCSDSKILNLSKTWFYNWNSHPDPLGICPHGRDGEYVPMIWGKTSFDKIPSNFVDVWTQAGVRYLLGFNEPDGKHQSNIEPSKAAALLA